MNSVMVLVSKHFILFGKCRLILKDGYAMNMNQVDAYISKQLLLIMNICAFSCFIIYSIKIVMLESV